MNRAALAVEGPDPAILAPASASLSRQRSDTLAAVHADGRDVLVEPEVYALLASVGIAVPRHVVVTSPGDVDRGTCDALGAAGAVVKLVSPDILHKSELGGVEIVANDAASLQAAVARVIATGRAHGGRVQGALVAERVPHRAGAGFELLAGFRHDAAFGPVVVAGPGGLDAEYLLDALRPDRARGARAAADVLHGDGAGMLRGTLVHDTLCGRRRGAAGIADAEPKLAALLRALAVLAEELAGFDPTGGLGLRELEVNPFVASDDGRLVALDGLARLHRPQRPAAPRPAEGVASLLLPRSALVVGVSAEQMNVGRVILRNLLEGGGVPHSRIAVVHPRADAIDGCRAYPTLAAVPEPVDMAVVAVPAAQAADTVRELVETRRARAVTLISGGLGETEAGRVAEAELRTAIDAAHREPDGGVVVNGGNCLGIVSVPGRYNTFFLPGHKLPFHDAAGQNVASISQSGAYLVSQISNLDRCVRPRYAISYGNQIDLTASDYLAWIADDPTVRVFALYVEGFRPGDGARFLQLTERLAREGRVVLLYKAGRTREGSAAAASHTASAVGDYDVCRDLARAAGAFECATLDMFEDLLLTFAFLAGRPRQGRRIGVLSNAGFECTAAADKLYGLEIATLAATTERRLRELLPAGVVDVHNPVDATPMTPTDRYAEMAAALAADPAVDALVVAGIPATPAFESLPPGEGHREDASRPGSLPSRLVRLFRETSKPIVFSVDSGPLYDPCAQQMKRAGLPCFRKIDRATRALATYLGALR